MSTETDQADRVLLAERVMGFVKGTDISGGWTKPDYYVRPDGSTPMVIKGDCSSFWNWDPFANAANAIEVMEALPKGCLVTIRLSPGVGYVVRINPAESYVQGKNFFAEDGSGFTRTLTTAIVRLVRERPDLFGGAE